MLPNQDRFIRKALHYQPTVLIVDDDVDAALFVAQVFWGLNCSTVFANEAADAQRRLVSAKADLVILDWVLGLNERADDILDRCIRIIAKYNLHQPNGTSHKTKLITYSSLAKDQIHVPESKYFDHLDHWQKPIQQRDILNTILPIIGGPL